MNQNNDREIKVAIATPAQESNLADVTQAYLDNPEARDTVRRSRENPDDTVGRPERK